MPPADFRTHFVFDVTAPEFMFRIPSCEWEREGGLKKKREEDGSLIFHGRGACVFSPRTNGLLTSAPAPSLTARGGAAFMRTFFHALAFIGAITFIEGGRAKQEGKLSGFTAEIPRDATLGRLLSL